MNYLKGIHHITAITSSAEKNYEFFTYVLGMRLVKKTVHQDNIKTYHLFFADDKGSAGTDMTFFEFPNISKGMHGTNEISKISFRVPTDVALEYWVKRFNRFKVKHCGIQKQFGKQTLSFVDFDNQQYQLISDEFNKSVASGTPWQKEAIPLELAIKGLGPSLVRIADFNYFKQILEKVMLFKEIATEGSFHLFEVGKGGNGGQVIVEHNEVLPDGQQGFGTVHHVAFRVEDRTVLDDWTDRLESFGFHTLRYVNSHSYESLFARLSPQILFEFVTDGIGFMTDELYETDVDKLSLPKFLKPNRAEIEKLNLPIYTLRNTLESEKKYE